MTSTVIKPMHKVLDDACALLLQGSNDVNLLTGRTIFTVPIEREIQAKADNGRPVLTDYPPVSPVS